jgi:hypothetical protein
MTEQENSEKDSNPKEAETANVPGGSLPPDKQLSTPASSLIDLAETHFIEASKADSEGQSE